MGMFAFTREYRAKTQAQLEHAAAQAQKSKAKALVQNKPAYTPEAFFQQPDIPQPEPVAVVEEKPPAPKRTATRRGRKPKQQQSVVVTED